MSLYAQAVAAERAAKIAKEAIAHESEIARLRAIEAAARNLVAKKGRYNTEVAYRKLVEALTPNAPHEGPARASCAGPLDAVVGPQRNGE